MRRLIQEDIANSKRGSVSTRQKKQECLNALEAYVGELVPIDCLQVISTGWLDGFEDHLLTASVSKKGVKALSRSTAAYMKKTLLSYCRVAIKRHMCPNMKILPRHGVADGKEIESLPAPDRMKDMERLLSLFYLKMERSKTYNISEDGPDGLKAQARGIGYAILSSLLCGTGYSGLSELLRDETSGSVVHIAHLDVDIKLPAHIFEILEWLRSNSRRRGAVAIEEEALRAVGTVPLSFKDGFKEPFTQWIEMALEAGVPASDARRLIDRLYVSGHDGTFQVMAQSAFDAVVSELRNFSYSWYCVKSALKGKADISGGAELLRSIKTEGGIRPLDSFCPRLKVVSDRSGRKEVRKDPLWDSILLVKANLLQIEAINRFLMSSRNGFIYGIPGDCGMEYSRIRDCEIAVIRSFFVDMDSRRISEGEDLTGRKVLVQTGLYEGYDGTIVKVVLDKDRNVSRLILKINGASASVTYNVDPDYVQYF